MARRRSDVEIQPAGLESIPPNALRHPAAESPGDVTGHLIDRIDIQLEVPAGAFREVASKEPGEKSKVIRERVVQMRR